MQVLRNGCASLLDRTRITPSQASAVEPARLGELRNLLLKEQILIARSSSARVQNHSGLAQSRTIDVQGPPPDIHGAAHLRKSLPFLSLANLFVADARKKQHAQQQKQTFSNKSD